MIKSMLDLPLLERFGRQHSTQQCSWFATILEFATISISFRNHIKLLDQLFSSGFKKSKNVATAAYRVVSVGVFFLQLSCVVCQKCTDAPFKLAFVLLAEQLGIS